MNADVIYPPELITRINDSSHETVLAVDIKKCGREEVKVVEGANHKIKAIGKELIEEHCLGEFLGVAKFSKKFNELFSESLTILLVMIRQVVKVLISLVVKLLVQQI